MEMARQCGGNDAPLIGLLRVYKDYYPDVIVREAVAGRAKVFSVSVRQNIGHRKLMCYSIQTKSGGRD